MAAPLSERSAAFGCARFSPVELPGRAGLVVVRLFAD